MSARAALGLVLAVLAVANVGRSTVVPSGWHLVANVALAAAVVAIGVLGGLRAPDLGLDPSTAGAGLRLGLAAAGVVAVVSVGIGVAAALIDAEPTARTDLSGATLLLRILVVIPVGTVLVEELIFRGVLAGLLHRLTGEGAALLVGAVLFGLWHVFPAWRDSAGSATAGRVGAAVGTFAFTLAGGLVFGWLRSRSDSLVAPMLGHWATNTLPLAALWVAAR